MNFSSVIKEVGRGARGARGLETDAAREAFAALLSGEVNDIQLGAWWLAMRIKGETASELQGFVRATHARCLPLEEASQVAIKGGKGIVLLPSYNGARKLPNLTALLAASLAQRGVNVLVHGPAKDPTRVTTAEVFEQEIGRAHV